MANLFEVVTLLQSAIVEEVTLLQSAIAIPSAFGAAADTIREIQRPQKIAPAWVSTSTQTYTLPTIEDIALARLLVKLKKPLRITDAKLVLTPRHFKNKGIIELQYEYIEPQSKAKVGSRLEPRS